MAPGFWLPALTNILTAKGLGQWVALVFVVPPLCALISPLLAGALADQRVAANRLYVAASLLSAVVLAAAFGCLDAGLKPWLFVGLLGLYSLIAGPMWSLLATISLRHLSDAERQFPLVRLGGTFGWMVAGVIVGYAIHDTSPRVGYASAGVQILGAGVACWLPQTPPLGGSKAWYSRFGLEAFRLLKQRDHCVFFIVTGLFSIPLTAFYMYAPEMLKALGDRHATATMTVAQFSEVGALLLVGSVISKFRVKTVLLWALALSVLRFGMSAYAGASGLIGWHIAGIALHGMCYAFYFITAQVFLDRRVEFGLKGQAQGLLTLVSGGLGPLAGAVVCGALRGHFVTANGDGWMNFWAVLAAMIGGCLLIFALFYRGLGRER
jgi:MFS family permease